MSAIELSPGHPLSRARKTSATAILVAALGLAVFGAAPASAASVLPPGAPTTVAAAESADDEVKYYVVQESFNGQQEFLFEIAERFLGDGNRFQEIFDLNEGRVQPDGGALTDPTSVLPGWYLVLPDDASGAGLEIGPVPGASAPVPTTPQPPASEPEPEPEPAPTEPAPTPAATAPPVDAGTDGQAENGAVPETDAQPAASDAAPVLVWIIIGVVVVLLLAAAAALLVWRRSRRTASTSPRAGTDRASAWTVDRALKALLTVCADEAIAFPGAYIVTISGSAVAVTLASPSVNAPTGWTASSDGRVWRAALAGLQSSPVREPEGVPFAGLISLGSADDERILLDLDQADGPIAVDGDRAVVDTVVEAWIAELTGNPWSGPVRTARISARAAADLDAAAAVVADLAAGERALIVFEDAPSRTQLAELRERLSDSATWVLIKGASVAASWRFSARAGVLSSGFLPDIRLATDGSATERLSAPSRAADRRR